MTYAQSSGLGMRFSSVLKGRLAERILVTLLERGGYRVTRLGIEELFDEVKYLPYEQYRELKLPKALRSLPDLLVADPTVSWAAMIEIKYRRRFDAEAARELHATLREQHEYWPESYTALMISEPFVDGGRFHQDFIRLIPPGEIDQLLYVPPPMQGDTENAVSGRVWDRLPMLTHLFRSFPGSQPDARSSAQAADFWRSADYITTAIRELSRLT